MKNNEHIYYIQSTLYPSVLIYQLLEYIVSKDKVSLTNNLEDYKIQHNHYIIDLDLSIPLSEQSEHCPIDNGTLFKYLKYLKNNEEDIFV